MARWLMLVPPVAFVALAGLFYAGMYRENPTELPSTFIGREAPAVPVAGLEGVPVLTDADLRSVNAEIEVLLREALAKRGVKVEASEPAKRGRPPKLKDQYYD